MKLKPLLRQTMLWADESLLSWLTRLAQLNFLPTIKLLSQLCVEYRLGVYWDDLACPQHRSTYDRLAQLTGAAPQDIYAASDYAFVPCFLSPTDSVADFLRATDTLPPLQTDLRFAQRLHADGLTPYCPVCLKQASYQRRLWHASALSICSQHDCFLLFTCPRCQRATDVEGVVTARCRECGADLRQARLKRLPDQTLGYFAQRNLESWLQGRVYYDPEAWSLPAAPPATLYALTESLLLSGLKHASELLPTGLQKQLTAHAKITNLTPEQRFHLYAWGFKFLIDWPAKWHGLPSQYADEVLERLVNSTSTRKLSHRQLLRLAPQSPSHLVQQALEAPISSAVAHTPFPLEPNSPVIPAEQVMRQLGITFPMTEYLIQLGCLTLHPYHPPRDAYCSRMLVSRESFEALQRQLDMPLAVGEAASWLCTSPAVVRGLAALEILHSERRSNEEDPEAIGIHARSVLLLLEQIRALPEREISGVTSTLQQAAVRLKATVGLDEAAIILRLLQHRLQAFRLRGEPYRFDLGVLRFTEDELDSGVARLVSERGWLDDWHASMHLGVNEMVIQDWSQRGLLDPVIQFPGASYCSETTLDNFEARYTFQSDVLQRLGKTFHGLEGLILQRKLKPVAGPNVDLCPYYLFERKDVEALGNSGRVG